MLVILFTGVQLNDFGPLFSSNTLYLGMLAVPITVFAAMGVINSFNLIDGMDGLSGSIFLVAAIGMAFFAALAGDLAVMWLLIIAMAAVLGFLLLNARLPWNEKARLFLGDAGSLMLGFVSAWCFIRLGSGEYRAFMPMTAVWLFAVPLLDTSTLVWMRFREGRSPVSADQKHLHHAFLRAGYSVPQTCLIITALAIVLGGVGFSFEVSNLPGYLSFYIFMAFAFFYYFYMKHSWATQRFTGRHFIHHDFEIDEGIVR
jgi:UDP-GlcNAc:undecaprenyl-phosphate GlcNAc-1-phosphate transferase